MTLSKFHRARSEGVNHLIQDVSTTGPFRGVTLQYLVLERTLKWRGIAMPERDFISFSIHEHNKHEHPLYHHCASHLSTSSPVLTYTYTLNTAVPSSSMSDHTTPVGLAVPTGKAPPTATSPDTPADKTHTPSQRYLSTRGGSYGVCDTFNWDLIRLWLI